MYVYFICEEKRCYFNAVRNNIPYYPSIKKFERKDISKKINTKRGILSILLSVLSSPPPFLCSKKITLFFIHWSPLIRKKGWNVSPYSYAGVEFLLFKGKFYYTKIAISNIKNIFLAVRIVYLFLKEKSNETLNFS